MKKNEMDKIVGEEREHIPKGDLNQNILRASHNAIRQSSLSKSKSYENFEERRKIDLLKAIESVKAEHPGFEPEYDKEYFGI